MKLLNVKNLQCKDHYLTLAMNTTGLLGRKTYNTEEFEGKRLWNAISKKLEEYRFLERGDSKKNSMIASTEGRYGKESGYDILRHVRVGQGAFRLMITETYDKRCAISGEKTLPVLEAAHIKPYADSGPYAVSNGLLLRSDIHKLFDSGYITITKNMNVEVSRRIKEEFKNGREYYRFHGKGLEVIPEQLFEKPGDEYIEWHNENVFR